ncbi:S-adenosyl-L-methionine-dependent methyltransferase, partial [Atractiella rhizophila]
MASSDPPLLQSTNTSATVSKRSAERAGYFEQEQWLRPFVATSTGGQGGSGGGKVKRRSPQINLGYYIRSHLIQRTINSYISLSSTKSPPNPAILVNLGSGYDATFFRLCSSHEGNGNIYVVDVDYPALIENKKRIIESDPALADFFEEGKVRDGWNAAKKYTKMFYALLGKDLGDLVGFKEGLGALVKDVEGREGRQASIAFIAEVSIIYLPPEHTRAILDYVSTFPQSTFIVLEQFIPSPQANSTYVQTMLTHFKTHQTPLLSLSPPPEGWRSLSEFEDRLKSRWKVARTRTMRELWEEECQMEEGQRRKWTKEEFDEWEEILLFLSHYYIGVASKEDDVASILACNGSSFVSVPSPQPNGPSILPTSPLPSSPSKGEVKPLHAFHPSLRLKLRGHSLHSLGGGKFLIFGGYGGSGKALARTNEVRLLSISKDGTPTLVTLQCSGPAPTARVHHVGFVLGGKVYVHGGRQGPATPMDDLWELDVEKREWKLLRKEDVTGPSPRSRHACVVLKIGQEECTLIGGGIGLQGDVKGDWWIWRGGKGWSEVELESELRVFGCDLVQCHPSIEPESSDVELVLLGGLNQKYQIAQTRSMRLHIASGSARLQDVTRLHFHHACFGPLRARFGSRATSPSPGAVVMHGGVSSSSSLPPEQDAILLDLNNASWTPVALNGAKARTGIDHALAADEDGNIVVVGGACNAFSFGTKWDEELLILGTDYPQKVRDAKEVISGVKERSVIPNGNNKGILKEAIPIQRVEVGKEEEFEDIMRACLPVVITGLSLGSASEKWTPEYLTERVGSKKVSVHVSSTANLSWHDKNFRYQTMNFSELLTRVFAPATGSRDETVYLRSLSSSAKRAAMLEDDFPELQADFEIPSCLKAVKEG